MFDEFIDVGYRVRLIYTKDRYTKLKKGDTGTVSNICELPKELDHAFKFG